MEENDRYVTFREYSAGTNELKDQVNDLRLQNARLSHLPDDVRAMTQKIDMLLQRPPPAPLPTPPASSPSADGVALAAHRLADLVEKQGARGNSVVPWIMMGVTITLAIGGVLWGIFA